jgi:hypothetical protein
MRIFLKIIDQNIAPSMGRCETGMSFKGRGGELLRPMKPPCGRAGDGPGCACAWPRRLLPSLEVFLSLPLDWVAWLDNASDEFVRVGSANGARGPSKPD